MLISHSQNFLRGTGRRINQGAPMKPAAKVFLDLAADGAEAEDQRSLSRKTLAILAAAVLMISVPLLWAATDQSAGAAPIKQTAVASDDDDDDGAAGDDDDTETGDDGTGDGTGTASNAGTGNDTVGNTDAGGQ